MSLFYGSNQQRRKTFKFEDRLREANQEVQQDIVDEQLAREFGLETESNNLSRLGSRVFEKLIERDGEPPVQRKVGNLIIADNIKKGTLSDLFDILKKSYKILNDISVKNEINNTILKGIEENQSAEVVADVVENMLKEVGINAEAVAKAEGKRSVGRPKGSKSKSDIRRTAKDMPSAPTEEPVLSEREQNLLWGNSVNKTKSRRKKKGVVSMS